MADVATGITIVFGTSAFTAEFIDVNLAEESRPVIDTSHQGTVDSRTKMPGRLADPGGFTATIAYEFGDRPPINAAAETITITGPTAGHTTPGTIVGTGFVSSWRGGGQLDQKATGEVTITWSDEPVYTAAT